MGSLLLELGLLAALDFARCVGDPYYYGSSVGHATSSCWRLEVNKHAQIAKDPAKQMVEKLNRVFRPKEDGFVKVDQNDKVLIGSSLGVHDGSRNIVVLPL